MKFGLLIAGMILLPSPGWSYTFTSGNDGFEFGSGTEVPGWWLNPGIKPSGTARVADGVLAITADAGQKVQFYTDNSFFANPGEKVRMAIRARGRGRFSLGAYLYTPGPRFSGEVYGDPVTAETEWQTYPVTLTMPAGESVTAHPVIAVEADSDLEFDDVQCATDTPVPAGWQPVQPGQNNDPNPGPPGEMPYEMANRTESHPPLTDFTDCARYVVENHHTDARLYRSAEQRLFRDRVGKVTYQALEPDAWFAVKLREPMAIPEDSDCVNVWNYGNSWCWVAEPHLTSSVLLLDADGKEVELELEPMYYTYWHIQHKMLPATWKRPLRFAGLRFKGGITRKSGTIYLDSVSFYRQPDQPLKLEDLPETLPFPTTPDTILPTAETDSSTRIFAEKDTWVLASSAGVEYRFSPGRDFLSGWRLRLADKEYVPFLDSSLRRDDGTVIPAELSSVRPDGDRLRLEYRLPDGHTLSVTARLRYKSLVLDFQESENAGQIEDLRLGKIAGLKAPDARMIPMISYGWEALPPQLVRDGEVFFFGHFDWYNSDGSELYAERKIEADSAAVMGGVRYFPTTAGVRNRLRERLVFTASTDVDEVFPNIPNPPSPMHDQMAHRAWRVRPGVDYAAELADARQLRDRGISDVAIRYHEATWRDGGESYTFRTEAAPGKGGNPALRDLIQRIQSLGWLAGVYTGYNDLSPVNAHWDEDALARDRNGNWITGWARCYQPKPLFAWQMERKLAPEIGRIFGNHHVYCDVHTAVAPWIRTDFDHRAPGAASFRKTFDAFGLLLSEQRAAYSGPVYSEGGCHWFYAGLLDGNYGQIFAAQPSRLDWFPDFNLQKIHPLSMDAGMGSPDMFFRGAPRNFDQFIATTLVYGNIAILDGTQEEMERMYYLLTPLQPYYVMEPVESIRWFDAANVPSDTSAALVSGVQRESRIRIRYRNGFTLYANGNAAAWTIAGHCLPQWGWLALAPDGKALGAREILDGVTVDWARGGNSLYWRSPSGPADAGWIAGAGTVILKRETSGWEIIPDERMKELTIDAALIGNPTALSPDVPMETVQSRRKLEFSSPGKYRVVR